MNEATFLRLKKEATEARARAERAKGAMEQVRNQLSEEFGCKSIEEAEGVLKELNARIQEVSRRFDALLSEYESKWKNGSAVRE